MAKPQSELPMPADFLKTIESIKLFAETLAKLKRSMDTGDAVRLTGEESASIVYGLQVLRKGPND